jgi:HSP20 family protein
MIRALDFHSARKEVDAMPPLHGWSAATELAKLDRDFEDVLNHFMRPDWGVAKPYIRAHHPPAIESFIDAEHLIVRADLPGIEPKDVEIRVDGNILTISGSRSAAAEEREHDFVHREIRYGNFERAISIPKGVRREEISAAYRNGVLELTIPLKGVEIRKVPVQMTTRAR